MRRGLLAGIALVGVLALTGCDPYASAGDPGRVQLDAAIRGDGSAQVQMYLDASEHDDAQLRTWGREVATRLFPDASAVAVRVDPNEYGYPFDVIEVTGAFAPGPHPDVRLDGRAAVGWLIDHGATRVGLSLTPPDVPATAAWSPDTPREVGGAWSWQELSTREDAPLGALALSPRPWQGLVPLLLVLVSCGAVVGSVIAFRRRRRTMGFILAGFAVLSPVADSALGGPQWLDHLAAAGWLPAGALPGTRWAMITPLVASLAGVVVLLVVAGSSGKLPVYVGRPDQAFVVPPGWPEPPPGWRPPLGWQPDPAWPPPPDGWTFFIDVNRGD